MNTHNATHPRAVDPAVVFTSCELFAAEEARLAAAAQSGSASAQPAAGRRQVVVKGRRVKTVDVHAHCLIPAASKLLGEDAYKHHTGGIVMEDATARLRDMDAQGIDVEALSINPNWYKAERDLAKQVCALQNAKLAETCAAHPDRFVAYATVALQHPDLAAEQLEEGVKKYNLRGAAIGGSVNGEEISDPKFHPFWAKAEQLGVVVFIHPQGTGAPAELSFLATLKYLFGTDKTKPYLIVDAGLSSTIASITISSTSISASTMNPEIGGGFGVQFPAGDDVNLFLQATANVIFNTGGSFTYIPVDLGVNFDM
jgi:hypothetical protein